MLIAQSAVSKTLKCLGETNRVRGVSIDGWSNVATDRANFFE